MSAPHIDPELCIHCGFCTTVCPVGAIVEAPHSFVIIEPLCICCGDCVQACPVEAIE